MEQILSEIGKIKNEFSEELKQEIMNIEKRINNIIDKELEVKKLREILVDIEYRLYKIEEKLEKEANKDLAEEVFKIRRKIAKIIVGIGYIHGI